MKAYYHYPRDSDTVPPESPVDLTKDEAVRRMYMLRGKGAYLALYLADGRVLQIQIDADAAVWVEILTLGVRARGTSATKPMAEHALEAAFEGSDIEERLSEFLPEWEDITIGTD